MGSPGFVNFNAVSVFHAFRPLSGMHISQYLNSVMPISQRKLGGKNWKTNVKYFVCFVWLRCVEVIDSALRGNEKCLFGVPRNCVSFKLEELVAGLVGR